MNLYKVFKKLQKMLLANVPLKSQLVFSFVMMIMLIDVLIIIDYSDSLNGLRKQLLGPMSYNRCVWRVSSDDNITIINKKKSYSLSVTFSFVIMLMLIDLLIIIDN